MNRHIDTIPPNMEVIFLFDLVDLAFIDGNIVMEVLPKKVNWFVGFQEVDGHYFLNTATNTLHPSSM